MSLNTNNNKTLPSIFIVKFGTIVPHNQDLLLADATNIPIKLYSCNSKYYDSIVCRRMMVSLTNKEIENEILLGNVILSKSVQLLPTQNVMVMTDEFTRIPKNINNAEEFLNYLMIADRLCINVDHMLNSSNTKWIYGKVSKIKQQHMQHNKLFTPVEYKDFSQPKFGPRVMGVAYPVGITKNNNPKPIKMNITDNKSRNINIYTEILEILNRCKKNCSFHRYRNWPLLIE